LRQKQKELRTYYFDKRLQYPVKVEKPDPIFARQLQQAIGGVEGEIRVACNISFRLGALADRRNIATSFSTRRQKKSAISRCWPPPLH
jgi:hypothetical protein